MKRHLSIAIFSPEKSVAESFAKDCKSMTFKDPEVQTSVHFIEGLESFDREYSYAMFTPSWYKHYDGQNIREILNLFTHRYWHGYLSDNLHGAVSRIIRFLQEDQVSEEADKKFYDSLANFHGFYHHSNSDYVQIC